MDDWIIVFRVNDFIEACSPPLPSREAAIARARELMAEGCRIDRIENRNNVTLSRGDIVDLRRRRE